MLVWLSEMMLLAAPPNSATHTTLLASTAEPAPTPPDRLLADDDDGAGAGAPPAARATRRGVLTALPSDDPRHWQVADDTERGSGILYANSITNDRVRQKPAALRLVEVEASLHDAYSSVADLAPGSAEDSTQVADLKASLASAMALSSKKSPSARAAPSTDSAAADTAVRLAVRAQGMLRQLVDAGEHGRLRTMLSEFGFEPESVGKNRAAAAVEQHAAAAAASKMDPVAIVQSREELAQAEIAMPEHAKALLDSVRTTKSELLVLLADARAEMSRFGGGLQGERAGGGFAADADTALIDKGDDDGGSRGRSARFAGTSSGAGLEVVEEGDEDGDGDDGDDHDFQLPTLPPLPEFTAAGAGGGGEVGGAGAGAGVAVGGDEMAKLLGAFQKGELDTAGVGGGGGGDGGGGGGDGGGEEDEDQFYQRIWARISKAPESTGAVQVLVAVRLRPFNSREIKMKASVCIELEGNTVTITDPSSSTASGPHAGGNSGSNDFSFDWAFDSSEPGEDEFIPQGVVFDALGVELLRNVW